MDYSQFEPLYFETLNKNGLSQFATPEFAGQFYRLTCLLTEANEKMNLTAIRDPADMIPLHYADCLLIADYLPDNAKLLDCGCGAGFPSLPLAIVRPDLSVTSLDSTAKKLSFVEAAARELKLTNLTTVCGRAEEFAHSTQYRERFDVCTARAVASLPVLSELCVPFLKIDGIFAAMKGAKASEELNEATNSLRLLGCSPARLLPCSLYRVNRTIHALNGNLQAQTPEYASEPEARAIILAVKQKHTPLQYPRKYSQILKKPL